MYTGFYDPDVGPLISPVMGLEPTVNNTIMKVDLLSTQWAFAPTKAGCQCVACGCGWVGSADLPSPPLRSRCGRGAKKGRSDKEQSESCPVAPTGTIKYCPVALLRSAGLGVRYEHLRELDGQGAGGEPRAPRGHRPRLRPPRLVPRHGEQGRTDAALCSRKSRFCAS